MSKSSRVYALCPPLLYQWNHIINLVSETGNWISVYFLFLQSVSFSPWFRVKGEYKKALQYFTPKTEQKGFFFPLYSIPTNSKTLNQTANPNQSTPKTKQ